MKKVIETGLLFIIIINLVGCTKVASNSTEMLEILKSECNISAEIYQYETVCVNESILIVAIAEIAPKMYNYYAAQFSIKNDDEYEFQQCITLHKYGWQISGCQWQHGMIFVCNNENAESFKATITKNRKEIKSIYTEIPSIPWVFYLDLSDIQRDYEASYIFLDKNGNNI